MTATIKYEVTASYALIMSKTTYDCALYGILYKGFIVEALNEINDWISISYMSKIGYVNKSSLQFIPEPEILGSVTIKYINENTNSDIFENKIYRDLKLGTYSYSAITIPGYFLSSENSQTITLTKDVPNITIIFKYTEILGSITLNYLDSSSNIELLDSVCYSNLKLGDYSYTSNDIPGFIVDNTSIQTITLTDISPNQVITFKYVPNYLDLDESIQNEVPYISTYYIKPIVALDEEVIIDYYITDYYHKDYVNDDFSEIFTVYATINDVIKIIKVNQTGGDHSISLGKFDVEGEINFSIRCVDKYGRSSHELFNYFLVRNEPIIKEYIMTVSDLAKYNIKNTDDYEEIIMVDVDLSSGKTMSTALNEAASTATIPTNKYVCFIGDSNGDGIRDSSWDQTVVKYGSSYDKEKVLAESKATRLGLQQLLDDKKAEGYNKLKMLKGIYRIDHESTIFIPSEFTLDMNKSCIKQNQFSSNKSLMMDINNCFDSHVINGNFDGDYFSHDYINSPDNSEWVNGIYISAQSKYCSYENIKITNITGYGSGNGISKSRDGLLYYTYCSPKYIGNSFKSGDISLSNGLEIASNTRTTCDFIDISDYIQYKFITISKYLGYQGNSCGTWNIICHFYDKNKDYLKSIRSYQYRFVLIPKESHFVKITICNKVFPTDLTVNLFRIPIHCSFINIVHNNCRCIGMAPGAMKNFLVDNCEFSYCGQAAAKCAYDAEDGWDQMQDITLRRLNFHNNPHSNFLTCAGHNFVLENFKSGSISFWQRTNSFIVRNCSNIYQAKIGCTERVKSGYSRFYNNTINSGGIKIDDNGAGNSLCFVVKDCTINGRAENLLGMGLYIRCTILANKTLTDSISTSIGNGNFKDCIIADKQGSNNYGGIYNNCTLINNKGTFVRNFELINCKIYNCSFQLAAPNNSYKFTNCTLNNSFLFYNYWSQGSPLTIENCTINSTDYLIKLPHYCMKSPINLINNTFISTGNNGMVYFYDDRTGGSAGDLIPQNTLTIKSNIITIENSLYTIAGLKENTINNINIISINNIFSPTSLQLCNPDAMLCPNITVIEK